MYLPKVQNLKFYNQIKANDTDLDIQPWFNRWNTIEYY